MPEEVNRVLTDAISDVLYVTEASGVANLAREGVEASKVVMAGNVMIDTLIEFRARARASDVTRRLGVADKSYVTVTLHRPSNVDDPGKIAGLVDMIRAVAEKAPVVFPVHPRTRARIAAAGLDLATIPGVVVCDPLGYVDFLALMDRARLLDDRLRRRSGGGVPPRCRASHCATTPSAP
jgi:UDP-N-acetylglucosamine 2-epimerase (non-hydrolysing)